MPLVVADEESVPVIVMLIKATYTIEGDRLRLADNQVAVDPAGKYWGDPGRSSYRYEPEIAFMKPSTDVVLIGHARGFSAQERTVDAGLKVGPVQKIVRVYGERYWVKTGGQIIATRPQPLAPTPLVYEHAFGGWDKAHKDETRWACERRNPVGRGFGDPLKYVEEGRVLMPSIEDPGHSLKRYGDTPPPAGFGFLSPHWLPRAGYAGTYDEAWAQSRKPLLPRDFDRRFLNSASPGLVAPRYLQGNEDVVIVNASPVPQLRFRLPDIPPPECRVGLREGTTKVVQTNLDTVIVDTDEMEVYLLWRNFFHIPRGPHEVAAVEIGPRAGQQIA